MANKLKKSNTVIEDAPEPAPVKSKTVRKAKAATSPQKFKADKTEKVDLKKLARDERTWKIIGTVCLLIAIFLFIAFTSYLFTWREDQSVVMNRGMGFLFDNDPENRVANLLGRLGAWTAHNIIRVGFGLASFLFCTFFFVVGINLLFERKVFSVWRNLKYVTVGLLLISVTLGFITSGAGFPFGGEVGSMISAWLQNFLGNAGTAILLLVVGGCYLIWQFNPVFKMPERKPIAEPVMNDAAPATEAVADEAKLFVEGEAPKRKKGNNLSADMPPLTEVPAEEEEPQLQLELNSSHDAFDEDDAVTDAVSKDLLHDETGTFTEEKLPLQRIVPPSDMELEIKEGQAEASAEGGKTYADLPPYDPALDLRDYKFPTIELLETHGSEKIVQDPAELEANKNQIINTLKNYDISIQKISATVGPTVTLYEIVPAAGVRISRIKNLEDDIALSLAALGIRIIAPIPGKGTIGIEVPNHKKSVVSMKTMLASEKFTNNSGSLPIAIGKKIDNELFIVDLATMPHMLMAGATGQGKSVGLNAILVSLLYKKHPSQLKLVLIDPKKVELSIYRLIENHFLAKLPGEEEAIITDTKKVINTLNALCIEMDNRYDLLKEAGARNIKEYNEKFTKRKLNPQKGHQYLPFIVLVIDEFADLIMTAGKEVEMPIARLAQLARAIGIHLIIATQRPSVNIITGTIKANFPSRIAFKVSSKIDSRTILDAGGAEQLIGKGDMLISHNGELVRLQCAFVDTPEVEKVVEFINDQRGYPQAFMLPEYVDEKELEKGDFDVADKDPYFEDAAKLIVQNQLGSTSLLQRRMKLGYNRAGRLMDQLEQAGVVGPNQGSKAREVLIKTEAELLVFLTGMS